MEEILVDGPGSNNSGELCRCVISSSSVYERTQIAVLREDFSRIRFFNNPRNQITFDLVSRMCFCLVIHIQGKAMATSYSCETNVTLFKYKKQTAERLASLTNIVSPAKENNEWCARNSSGGSIEAMPKCGYDLESGMHNLPKYFYELFD